MERTEKALIRYLAGDLSNFVINCIFSMLCLCGHIFWREGRSQFLTYFLMSLPLVIPDMVFFVRLQTRLSEARKNGMMQEYVNDYVHGTYYMDHNICLGDKFIFASGMGLPVSYDDIRLAYLKRGRKRSMDICIQRKDGKSVCLYTEPIDDKDEDAKKIVELCEMIHQKNPEIRVGLVK